MRRRFHTDRDRAAFFRSGLSNGFVEATNSQIQAATARAKGYATTANMTVIAYLLCARLKHLPRNRGCRPGRHDRVVSHTDRD